MDSRDATVKMVGEMLLLLQKFERFLAAVLMTITTPAEADTKLRKALLRDKETLGSLMNSFAERTELPEHFAETFDGLLERRNVFVHSLFMQPWFDLKTVEGCERLDRYMTEIRVASKVCIHVMLGALHARIAMNPLTEDAERYIDQILLRVNETAEPYFGRLTEDEYIDKVVARARNDFTVRPREV